MKKMSTRTKRAAVGVFALALLSPMISTSPASAADGWMDTSLSADERAELLLEAMSLEQKVDLMTGDQGRSPTGSSTLRSRSWVFRH